MDNQDDLRKKTIWSFTYKGFACEIVNWTFESGTISGHETGNWNGYIYIRKEQLGSRFRRFLLKPRKLYRRTHWDNYSKFEKYFDFHGGITYYELLLNEFTGKPQGIKVGCDYLHSFDEGRSYDESDVKRDLEKSVDEFIKSFPDYKVWDIQDGKYRKPEVVST